jgi:hypothetical protein
LSFKIAGDLGDGQELVVDIGRATLSAHAGVVVLATIPDLILPAPSDRKIATPRCDRRKAASATAAPGPLRAG